MGVFSYEPSLERQKTWENAKKLWGPFWTSQPNPPSYEWGPVDLRQTPVDPTTMTSPEILLRKASDWLYNVPGKVNNFAANPPVRLDEVVAPVAKQFDSWWNNPKAVHDKRQAAERQRVSPQQPQSAAFSPTGESELMKLWVARESGGDPKAKNPNSTASGKHQFIEQTWLATIKRHGDKIPELRGVPALIQQDKSGRYYIPDAATQKRVLDLRFNEKVSDAVAPFHGEDLITEMTPRLGRKPTPEELYMGVFLGGPLAATVAKLPPDASVGAVLPASYIKANAPIFPQGAATTVATFKQRLQRKPSSGGTLLASQTVQLPGPPPDRPMPVPTDFSRAEEILASMRPARQIEGETQEQVRDLILAGWAQGISSSQGGIPGMLARMGAGGFAGLAQGKELERQLERQAQQDMLRWQGQAVDLELTKASTRAREKNAALETDWQNKGNLWEHKLRIAQFGKLDIDANGMMQVQTASPDGQSVQRSIYYVGNQLMELKAEALQRIQGGRSFFSGADGKLFEGWPDKKKAKAEEYLLALRRTQSGYPGGDAAFLEVLADEIVESPYKMDILGGDPKKHQAEILKLAALYGGDTKRAELVYIVKELNRQSRENPDGMARLMQEATGKGLVGPLMMKYQ